MVPVTKRADPALFEGILKNITGPFHPNGSDIGLGIKSISDL